MSICILYGEDGFILVVKCVWVKLNKTVHSVYACSAVSTPLYNNLAPAWPPYCKRITEELRVIFFALIGPIDEEGDEFPYVDQVPTERGGHGKRNIGQLASAM